jgi:hypothetical protein
LFERGHHRRIATVLESLNASLLVQKKCLFGGGTAIALRFGEYRESVDIDFIVSDVAGYRDLRQMLTGPQGLAAITRPGHVLQAVREIRADQYGLRTLLLADQAEIKFEIVLEARIQLEPPGNDDAVCGVAALTPLDMATTKLLANSDRWADDSVFSRDLIDLAMMQPKGKLLKLAVEKARGAYGESIQADLAKAIAHLLGREGRLERCMAAMQIKLPKALLWQRIKALAPR